LEEGRFDVTIGGLGAEGFFGCGKFYVSLGEVSGPGFIQHRLRLKAIILSTS
jgi:hypothetical protein